MNFFTNSAMLLLSLSVFSQQEWKLDECIAFAFKNNLQILESSIRPKIQATELSFQKNKRLPSISATVNNGISYGFQQVFSGEFVGQYKEIKSYGNEFRINASITLWNKNAQKINIEKEKIYLNTSLLNTQQQKFELKLEIIAKFYSVLIAKERLQLAKQIFNTSKKHRENKEKLYRLGSISKSILSEDKSNWIQDKQVYQTEKTNLKKALFELAVLLQLPNKNDFDITENSNDILKSEKTLDEIMSLSISNRSSIEIAKQKIKISENVISNYKTQYYPKVTLDYSLGTSAQQIFNSDNIAFKEQFHNNFYQYGSVGIQIPIFNQGNTKNRIQQAKIKRDLEKIKLAQEVQAIKNTVESLYLDVIVAKENYATAKETEQQTKEVYHFSEKLYEIGEINTFEFIGKKNEYVLSKLKKTQNKYELLFKLKLIDSYTLKIIPETVQTHNKHR
jgi:outer membrane protein